MKNILKEAKSLFEYSRDLRREFHRHPEIGFQETTTAKLIVDELNKFDLQIKSGVAKTGVVALLDTGRSGPVVMLRTDMDALPITEETDAAYASLHPGRMHACGHDGHMATILTVARLLHQHRDELCGAVKFVFQPAEEGLGGAMAMMKAGVLENPTPDYLLGMHFWAEQPSNQIVVSPGPLMAGSETFSVTITGRGGHGALPNLSIDPVVAAVHVISSLQSIVSRNIDPLQSAVISVTKVTAGTTHNVIPSTAEFSGTIRTFDPEVRRQVLGRFRQIVNGTAKAMDVDAAIDIQQMTSAVVNDEHVCRIVADTIAQIAPDLTIVSGYRTMVSEDVAFFMEKIPGCFLLVGAAPPGRGQSYGHHHPKFDLDEHVLPLSSAILAASTMNLLNFRP